MAKVLVIDDQASQAETFRIVLRNRGHEVVWVGDGHAAVPRLAEIRPDLVTTDLTAPGMSGFEVIRAVKSFDPHLPVIVVSGSLTPERKERAERLGAGRVLPKPFDVREFREAVAEALAARLGKRPDEG